MDANERTKRLYETLILFEENDYSEEHIASFLKELHEQSLKNPNDEIAARKYMETSRIYFVLRKEREYLKLINFHVNETNEDKTYMQITEAGWEFINNYQSNERDKEAKIRDLERMKALEKSHLENEKRIGKLTWWLVFATFILALGAIVDLLKYFHIHLCL